MIGKMKNAVKAALIQRKIENYHATLDSQYIGYNEWISVYEEQYCNRIQNHEHIRVIEFKECGRDFMTSLCKEDGTDSILIFVADRERLSKNALRVICDFFQDNPECVLAYGDEDEWNYDRTVRMNPWWKPDFSPDTLLQYFYYGNVFALRSNSLSGIVWKASDDCLYNLYDMCLQLSLPVCPDRIGHIQYVLYHADFIKPIGVEEEYHTLKDSYSNAVKNLENDFKISIVIPSKDHSETLNTCLKSLNNQGNIEIVVVDNGSCEEEKEKYEELKVKYGFNYMYKPMDFNFSKMCNTGAEEANGEYLLFLNDDIEAMEEDAWMERMVFHASKAHVGAVGAKLYYPGTKTIQHAGITNLRLGPVHKMQFLPDERSYYDGRNTYDRNVLAVTGACLMIRSKVFASCGGFSEDLAVAFNDVELCFRLYKMGYYNVQCNSAVLYHHESLSRGDDETQEKQLRLQKERRKMYDMHPDLYGKDPFYHPFLNTDILDTNFSNAYEYPAGEDVDICMPNLLKNGVRTEWYNDCLLISFEYAGELSAWMNHSKENGRELFFQGYQFVIGSDNAGFKRSVLLKDVETRQVYEVPCVDVFRPDLDVNIEGGHVSLCGFSFVLSKDSLKKGRYQVGCMSTSLVGRQKLCRFINKFVEV